MDDCLLYGPTWAVVVAGMDLCLDRVRLRRPFHRHERAPGRCIPRHLPRRRANKLWRVMGACGALSIVERWHGAWRSGILARIPSFILILHVRCSVWYGVQASIGGDCVKVLLRAMWPSVNDIRGCLCRYYPLTTAGSRIVL